MKSSKKIDYFSVEPGSKRKPTLGEFFALATVVVLTLIALVLMWMSVRWNAAENYASLLLLIVAVPLILVEALCCQFVFRSCGFERAVPGDAGSPLAKSIALTGLIVSLTAVTVGFAFR